MISSKKYTELQGQLENVQKEKEELAKSAQSNLEDLEKKEREATMGRSDFLVNMCHEIRTSLSIILGITEIDLQDPDILPRYQNDFEEIYSASHYLLSIANDILDLAKLESGKFQLNLLEYDLGNLLEDLVRTNVKRIGSRDIQFKLKLDPNLPDKILGDEARLNQILDNLISNAFKYTEKGIIELEARFVKSHGDKVTLAFVVTDSGQGMSKEQLTQLFATHGDEAGSTQEGAGLGLQVTSYMVKAMEGEMFVSSTLGEGSVFTVNLNQARIGNGTLGEKIAKELEALSISKDVSKSHKRLEKEYMPYGRVLVVDDVEQNLIIVKGLLAKYGIPVETAVSGQEAINKILDSKMYDIIFMDQMMPNMSGIEAVKKIRSLGYRYPIIALTANAPDIQISEYLSYGFNAFMAKPIDARKMDGFLLRFIRDRHRQFTPIETIKEAGAGSLPVFSEEKQKHFREVFAKDIRKSKDLLLNMQEKLEHPEDITEQERMEFVVSVHGLKGGAPNVGELELSALAKELEMAGKASDYPLIKERIPNFLAKLDKYLNSL